MKAQKERIEAKGERRTDRRSKSIDKKLADDQNIDE